MSILTPVHEALLTRHSLTLATCWTLTRTDGTVFRFTDHDAALNLSGNTFTPVGGFSASARQKQVQLQTRNLEIKGVLNDNAITIADLRAGRYRNAKLTERIVDWRFPFTGSYMLSRYWVSDVKYNGEFWEAQLDSLARWLRAPVGDVYTRHCRYDLGDEFCKVDLGPITESGTVTSVISNRYKFDSDLGAFADGYFKNGLLTWTSGANLDVVGEVGFFGTSIGQFRLHIGMPYDIEVGDTFNVYKGCDKTIDGPNGCASFENPDEPGSPIGNVKNYGGFPLIPGTDKMLQTPASLN